MPQRTNHFFKFNNSQPFCSEWKFPAAGPPDGAQVYFTGLLDGVARNGEQVGEVRDLFCKLKKVDGKWRISEMNIREVLEK